MVLPGRHCFDGTNGDTEARSGEKDNEGKEKLAISADLHGLVKAHKVTAFMASKSKGIKLCLHRTL